MEAIGFHRTFVPETSRNKGVDLSTALRFFYEFEIKPNSNYRVKIDTSLDSNYTHYDT